MKYGRIIRIKTIFSSHFPEIFFFICCILSCINVILLLDLLKLKLSPPKSNSWISPIEDDGEFGTFMDGEEGLQINLILFSTLSIIFVFIFSYFCTHIDINYFDRAKGLKKSFMYSVPNILFISILLLFQNWSAKIINKLYCILKGTCLRKSLF